MNTTGYVAAAIAPTIALAVKSPALIRNRDSVLLRCVCTLMALAAAVLIGAAPPCVRAVNTLTGVPNFAALLVYCLMTAFSASCLVLLVHWRGGPPARVRRDSRNWIAGYTAVVLVLCALFARGDAPVERPRDLDTYYATEPFIREMIVLYLLALATAAVAMVVLCCRWMCHLRGWPRAGLLCQVATAAGLLGYAMAKLLAVSARWAGCDTDYLSTRLAPAMAAMSLVVSSVGYILPIAGPRLERAHHHWRQCRSLAPLWREVTAHTHTRGRGQRTPCWILPSIQLTDLETVIADRLLELSPYGDPAVHTVARRQALADGLTLREAEATAAAATIAAAVVAERAHQLRQHDGPRTLVGAAPAYRPFPAAHLDLVRVAQALSSSSLVDEARRRAHTDAARLPVT
ncbi:MAB_1171c family putative transporter [Streptomyces sp. MNP-20]|uniref:MAB_1171c family putative transporter n=1 Tax=Streptomyces sp. MNP-20 TaxID=2721165 RepID=UPI001555F77D|nr:MAB_1171c family putative transporter [Streptomyces sp. MNP-20]